MQVVMFYDCVEGKAGGDDLGIERGRAGGIFHNLNKCQVLSFTFCALSDYLCGITLTEFEAKIS